MINSITHITTRPINLHPISKLKYWVKIDLGTMNYQFANWGTISGLLFLLLCTVIQYYGNKFTKTFECSNILNKFTKF